MPIKNMILRFQPAQLYIVLVLSICYFSIQLVLSHITHALTLLMASYHMLCNIFALTGCIVTIKHSKLKTTERETTLAMTPSSSMTVSDGQPQKEAISSCIEEQSLAKRKRLEMKLRNTFGWTRIDILTMLMVCIVLASLSFSLLVEALQTLVHIDHQDSMHLPIPVMTLGLVGLVLNGLTYMLIGGYTMHQGSFLHVTPDGDVVLSRSMSNSGELTLKANERQLSKTSNDQFTKEDLKEIGRVHYPKERQGSVEILRDVSSTLFVIVCSFIVYMAQDEEHTAKLVDPVLSIFSCVLLVSLSYPYMKESCLILLQTIPGSINMEIFESQLVSKFPEIISYHDLHIWQLSAQKYVSTVHIKFRNPKLYAKIIDDVRAFFTEQGIAIITIQPEFHIAKSAPSLECLVQCSTPECAEKVCCRDSRTDLREVSVCSGGAEHKATKDDHHEHGDDHDHHSESVLSHGHSHSAESVSTKGQSLKSPETSEKSKELKLSMLAKLKNVLHNAHSTKSAEDLCDKNNAAVRIHSYRVQTEAAIDNNGQSELAETITTTASTSKDVKTLSNANAADEGRKDEESMSEGTTTTIA